MSKNVDVKATLRLDDLASALLDKIKGGFAETADEAKEAQSSFAQWTQTAANVSMILGTNLRDVTARVTAFGRELIGAAAAGMDADFAIAGLISTVQGRAWGDAVSEAQGLNDELDMVAVRAGVANDHVGAAMKAMLDFTGATAEGVAQARARVEDIAIITGKIGGNTEAMAREYALMVEGIVRTKAPLFQLLQTTGIFGKETRKAAEYWAKLTEEDRMRLLAQGIGQVSGQLSKATPSFNNLLTSVANLWDVAKEKLGEPFTEALSPVLHEMIENLKEGGPALEAFAKAMAVDVGRWVGDAAKDMQRGFEYVRTHAAEIKETIVSAFENARSVVSWILAHKEEIALAFGVKMAAPAIGGAGRFVGSVFSAGAKGGAVTGAGSLGGIGAGGGALAGAGAVAAFAAAVAAWTLAIDQWSHLMDITQGGMSDKEQDFDAYRRYFTEQREKAGSDFGEWGPERIKEFERVRKVMVDLATELGEDSRAAGELADSVFRAHRAARVQVEQYDHAIAAYEQLQKLGEDTAALDFSGMATNFATGFQSAIAANNTGAAQYIANLTLKSKELQTALLFSSEMTADGFNALAAMVEGKSKEFAEQLRAVGAERATAAKPAAPKIHMSGGQVFKIEQNFRDQDPDRVAFVFQRDIAKAAERRIQASTVSPFGT